MIICDQKLPVIDFLNAQYIRPDDVEVIICEGHDCIKAPDGEGIGFGVLDARARKIYIAGDLPEKEEDLPFTIAHEYRHFMQYCAGVAFDEQDADDFAAGVMERLKKEQKQ